MRINSSLLIEITVLIAALIAIVIIVLLSKQQPIANENNSLDNTNYASLPTASQPQLPQSYPTQSDFYKKYLTSNIEIAKAFPFDNKYFDNYYNFDLSVKGVLFKLVLTNGSDFSSTRQMIEKMYLSNDVSGNIVSSYSGEISGKNFEMGIMNVPVGPITYMLFGGFIENGKGYYFQVFLDRKDLYSITDESFNDIYKFNNSRNPAEILDILIKTSNENLSDEFFNKFDNSVLEQPIVQQSIESRKRTDNFPTTF